MKELFQASGVGREGFERILNQYPYARAAAADIRPLVDAGAVALEDYLRDHLRDSTDVFARQRYREMPLYLQHLLFAVSSSYASAADNHDRVINAALSLGEAIFVTLNYDTLLDRELSKWSSGIRSIDSYVEVGSPWSLVKLHGSVNWGRRYNGPADVFREGGEPDPLTATIRSVGDSLEEFPDGWTRCVPRGGSGTARERRRPRTAGVSALTRATPGVSVETSKSALPPAFAAREAGKKAPGHGRVHRGEGTAPCTVERTVSMGFRLRPRAVGRTARRTVQHLLSPSETRTRLLRPQTGRSVSAGFRFRHSWPRGRGAPITDLMILAQLSQALARARAVPIAA